MTTPGQKQPPGRQNRGNPETDEESAFSVTGEPEPNRKAKGDSCGGEEQGFRSTDSLVGALGSNGGR